MIQIYLMAYATLVGMVVELSEALELLSSGREYDHPQYELVNFLSRIELAIHLAIGDCL